MSLKTTEIQGSVEMNQNRNNFCIMNYVLFENLILQFFPVFTSNYWINVEWLPTWRGQKAEITIQLFQSYIPYIRIQIQDLISVLIIFRINPTGWNDKKNFNTKYFLEKPQPLNLMFTNFNIKILNATTDD